MISVNKRGNPILICPLGYVYSQHVITHNAIFWRCNTSYIDTNGKSKRCGIRVRTKQMANGREMIEMVKQHDHDAKPPKSF